MSNNRDLLKEAIADAKSVKETAIANAKAALEEAFTPHLKSMFSAKINEMEEEEEMEENMDENEQTEESIEFQNEEIGENVVNEEDEDEINLEELMSELEKDEMEEVINDPRGPGAHGNIGTGGMSDDALMEAEEETEEEMSIEDMSEEDLKDFIESVIKEMVASGEIEAGEEEEEEEEEEDEAGESIDEFLNEIEGVDLKEYDQEHEISTEEALAVICKSYPDNTLCKGMKEGKAAKAAKAKMSKELEEAYSVINAMKKDISEVNLLNAKLLYTNKIFRNKSLTESQKINILGAFDKATTTKEAKLVYESLLSNLKTPSRNIQENLGRASKSITVPQTKQPIIESNDMIARFQKLAGIIK
jgi:DNA-directed RNA polymerase subunit L